MELIGQRLTIPIYNSLPEESWHEGACDAFWDGILKASLIFIAVFIITYGAGAGLIFSLMSSSILGGLGGWLCNSDCPGNGAPYHYGPYYAPPPMYPAPITRHVVHHYGSPPLPRASHVSGGGARHNYSHVPSQTIRGISQSNYGGSRPVLPPANRLPPQTFPPGHPSVPGENVAVGGRHRS